MGAAAATRPMSPLLSRLLLRVLLDANGKLSFGELCKGLRRLGYAGDFTSLWERYGGHQRGHIALADLDPEAENLVTSFLTLFSSPYGTLDKAWRLGFGKDPNEAIDEKMLTEACEKLGYGYNPKKLFRCLQPTAGKLLLTIWDLDPQSTCKRQHGEQTAFSTPKSPVSNTAPRKPFGIAGDEYYKAHLKEAADKGTFPSNKKSQEAIKAGETLLPNLRYCLKMKHGTTVAAWRNAMDPKLSGSIAFGNFALALEDCNFSGNSRALWKVLAGDRGVATFEGIDPKTLKMLERAREQLLDKFGTLSEAWLDGFKAGEKSWVPQDKFLAAIKQHGLAIYRPEKLFKALRARISQKALIMEDFRAFLIGLPSELHAPVWALPPGQARMPRAGAASASPSSGQAEESTYLVDNSILQHTSVGLAYRKSQNLEDKASDNPDDSAPWNVIVQGEPIGDWLLLENGFFLPMELNGVCVLKPTPPEAPPSPSSPMSPGAASSGQAPLSSQAPSSPSSPSSPTRSKLAQKLLEDAADLDKAISTVDGFKRKLIEKYGSLFAAWMNLLDKDHNNIMARVDFAEACRHLGVRGITRLWGELDPMSSGHVSLKEFDPESDTVINELRSLLTDWNPNTKVAWRKVFDPDNSRRTDFPKFARGCQQLGFSCVPIERAFQLLKPETGRPQLAYEDCFHDVDRNDNNVPPEPKVAASPKSTGGARNLSRAAAEADEMF
mmetsp:Transcript_15023/g.39626  ORF Transcript_15023/g.39626 Transcript_15023/m.39626 type:complete len:722 (+) Transcript_15023:504-2669(+)